jgi:hypothetical protein
MSTGVVTDLTHAIIRDRVGDRTIDGVVVTRPALKVTDGNVAIYACDVNVGIMTADGRVNQTQLLLEGVPGGWGFQIQDTNTIGTILRNVPLASDNAQLRYADVGNGVTLSRTSTGQWQVTGFSIQLPGTRTRIPVNISQMTIGTIQSISISGRLLTFGEIGIYGGGFGVCPFGASGLFSSGKLIEVIG